MIWDIALHKLLRHDDARFTLDVGISSDASRLVLFGPSGAGKSQTLKMLAGIVQPDRGRVAVGGRLLYDSQARIDLSPQQRRLAYVFQDYALFPHLTVRQNIAFGRCKGWLNPPRRLADEAVDRWIEAFHLGSVAGHYPHQLSGGQRQRTALGRALVNDPTALPHLTVRQNIAFGRCKGWLNPPRRLADEAVDRWIEAFHLGSVAGHYPHQLSGGQRQRTALGRALVNDPTALVLDEPFAALDQNLRQLLRDELAGLLAELRIPMLLITHDEEDVRALGDEVVHLRAGQVVAATVIAAEAGGGKLQEHR